MIQSIYVAAHFLEPVIPNGAKKIFKAFGSDMKSIRELSESNNLEVGAPVMKSMILYDMKSQNKHNRKKRGETNKGKTQKKLSAKALAAFSQERLAFRVGRITKVWPMENSDKLYCEEIDLGEVRIYQSRWSEKTLHVGTDAESFGGCGGELETQKTCWIHVSWYGRGWNEDRPSVSSWNLRKVRNSESEFSFRT